MGIQVSHGIEDTQSCAYSPLGIIFMRVGIAKIHQKPIPKELGDIPIESGDGICADFLVGCHKITRKKRA
jgi:hypothetical protein